MSAVETVAAEWVPLESLRAWDRNPRRNDPAVDKVAESISRFGFAAPIVARRENGEIIAGHTRYKAARKLGLTRVPVRFIDLDEEEAHKLALADNRLGEIAEWDVAALSTALDDLPVEDVLLAGWTEDEVARISREARGLNELMAPTGPIASGSLTERFLVAPFSVLNAREGWWQDRKRAWISLGIKSELGRTADLLGTSPSRNDPRFYRKKRAVEERLGRTLSWEEFVRDHHDVSAARRVAPGGSPDPLARARGAGRQNFVRDGLLMNGSDSGNDPRYYAKKRAVEERLGRSLTTEEFQRDFYEGPESYTSGTSIFDPVLCELVYRWFAPRGGSVLDPFAGGSVRGLVASILGRRYTGVDLRAEQVEANQMQARNVLLAASDLSLDSDDPTPSDEDVVTDPEALTPVQRVGDVWIKRDDLFVFAGARGSKARAGWKIGQSAAGLSVAGSRTAPMISRVARIGEALGIPVRCHVAGSKSLTSQERDAVAHGAELVKHRVNYLRTLVAKSRADAADRTGWRHIELGLESDEYVEMNAPQAANVPAESRRVVVCVGSGNGLSCVLHGLDRAGLGAVPVLGVCVGFDPTPLLDRRAPSDWRERVTLVQSDIPFDQRAPTIRLGGVELDPHYEAKCLPFLEPDDCLYVLARRTVDEDDEPTQEPDAPKWQKGFPIESLREVASIFRAHDEGMILGAFTAVRETQVADAWSRGDLRVFRDGSRLAGAAVVHAARSDSAARDFTGAERATIRKGDLVVRRLAYLPGYEAQIAGAIRALGDCWVEAWQEHGGDRSILASLNAECHAVKIRASSEQVGVYRIGAHRAVSTLSPADRYALCRLDLALDVEPLRQAIERLDPQWADHYSGYNKRHTWSALALRGYGGRDDFIEKPEEMSRKWREANAEKLSWELADTPLRALLPEAEALIAAVPGVKHRIRLMRLSARTGELTRHADITDPLAGTRPGELLRIHVPIQTNDRVLFQQWRSDGSRERAHMGAGEVWSLDTRKPHTAINGGDTDRLHLVMDVESCPALLALLHEPAQVVAHVEVHEVEPVDAEFSTPEERTAPREPRQFETPRWIAGDSLELPTLLGAEQFDLVFSCPPYADLERYSDDPRDLSRMDYASFLATYREIIFRACARLREDRFAVFVVGDVRDRDGIYRGFVGDTIQAFRDAGLRFYNDAVLVTAAGSLPVRAGRHFEVSRKLGKTHQNVLVFVKGSGPAATRACGEVEADLSLFSDPE